MSNCIKRAGWGRKRRTFTVTFLVLAAFAATEGCTRRFFRNHADDEVSEVLAQKDRYPAWQIEEFHIYPDARALFADPTNPDRPPMPPDDPASYDSAPNPQRPRKAGIAPVE